MWYIAFFTASNDGYLQEYDSAFDTCDVHSAITHDL
jgi:hypothetical protein